MCFCKTLNYDVRLYLELSGTLVRGSLLIFGCQTRQIIPEILYVFFLKFSDYDSI